MLPVILTSACRIGLCGAGPALERRRALLREAAVQPVIVAPDADAAALRDLQLLFVAGLDAPEPIASRARAAGVAVNVEDVPALCDFHVPAMVRRGDLILTVSTSGKAPGFSRLIREWLAARFGDEWAGRLAETEAARAGWRQSGAGMQDVSERLRRMVAEKGWLP